MKTVSSDTAAIASTEVKAAELVLLLDGLRIEPAILSHSHEVLGESATSCTALTEGVRARIRLRNNTETLRSMVHPRSLRVSSDCDYCQVQFTTFIINYYFETNYTHEEIA